MPKFDVTAPDGQKFEVNAPSGATENDAIAYVQQQFYGPKQVSMPAQEKGFGGQLSDALADVPRQLGLTARYGLQGVGGVLDAASSPIRGALNMVLPKKQNLTGVITGSAPQDAIQSGSGIALADMLGLPKPQSDLEKTVGSASELVAGGAVPVALAAKAVPLTTGATQGVMRMLAANPGAQAASNAAAGAAGEYTKQTGGGEGAQLAASLAAGLLAPTALAGGQKVASTVKNLVARAPSNQAIDVTIQNLIDNGDFGVKYADVGARVKQQLRDDIGLALSAGTLDNDAARRLIDYRLVGATPTKGALTLNQSQISREKNLAKIGVNSDDKTLQGLSNIQNENNNVIIRGLNDLGAATGDDAVAAGSKVIGSVADKNDAAKSVIDRLYSAARDSSGRSVPLDGAAFVNSADDMLKKNLLQGRVPDDVRAHMNSIAKGEVPFDVDYAEQLKTLMGDISRANKGTPEAKALGLVRQALDNAPPTSDIGAQSIDAFNKARRVNRGWMDVVDRTPALQAVRDGVEPDKFVNKYIIGSGNDSSVRAVGQLKNLVKSSPEAMDAIRGQIASFIKSNAVSGASDEVGKVSQSSLNSALNKIGDRKLSMFFAPEEVAKLKALGRVASYEQVQPVGSAVNNSNSGALALSGMLDFITNNKLLSRVPFAEAAIRKPLQNWSTQIDINQARNVPAGLLAVPAARQRTIPMGLLTAPLLLPANANSTKQE